MHTFRNQFRTMVFMLCFGWTGWLSADNISIHITDFGINQFWRSYMKIGMDFFFTPDQPDLSHNMVYREMHEQVRADLGAFAKSQILLPMPDDDLMKADPIFLEDYIYTQLLHEVVTATENGNRDFEIQLIQNISSAGYAAPWRQKSVEKFANAAYGAISRMTRYLEAKKDHTVSVDAVVGSNGTVGLGKAIERMTNIKDHISFTHFVDGRASADDLSRVIGVLGAEKVSVINTRGDYPDDWDSIANHEVMKQLLKKNPTLEYQWLEPMDASKWIWNGGAHVLSMAQPDASFRVRRFYMDRQNNLASYDMPDPLKSREIRQILDHSNRILPERGDRLQSIRFSERIRDLQEVNRVARDLISMMPSDSKVLVLGDSPFAERTKYWLKAKMDPANLYELAGGSRGEELDSLISNTDLDFVISSDGFPRGPAFEEYMIVSKNLVQSFLYGVDQYTGFLSDFDRLSKTEKGLSAALGLIDNANTLTEAFSRDVQNGIAGDYAMVRSDTFYESAKLFADKTIDYYIEQKKLSIPLPLTSCKKAAETLMDAVRDGEVQIEHVQNLAKASVGGLSYTWGWVRSGGNAEVAAASERAGLITADLVDVGSKWLGAFLVSQDPEFKRNTDILLDQYQQAQEFRIKNNMELLTPEQFASQKDMAAMHITRRDFEDRTSQALVNKYELDGQLKEYSFRRYKDYYGNSYKVTRLRTEQVNADGSVTASTRTITRSYEHKNGSLEQQKIQQAMDREFSEPQNPVKGVIMIKADDKDLEGRIHKESTNSQSSKRDTFLNNKNRKK